MEKMINGVRCKAVATEYDVYFDMAMAMLDEIIAHGRTIRPNYGERTIESEME